MSKYVIESSTLTGIADAIREKNGLTDTYKPSEMADAIAAIESGEGTGMCLTGDLTELFRQATNNTDTWPTWAKTYYYPYFINERTSTNNITCLTSTFFGNKVPTEIPFDLNLKAGEVVDANNCFNGCEKLTKLPVINGMLGKANQFLYGCWHLTDVDSLETVELAEDAGTNLMQRKAFFRTNYSLRRIPESFLKQLFDKSTYDSYNYAFYQCYVLDNIKNMGIFPRAAAYNMFSNTFYYCIRVNDVLFATNEDGTPIVAPWYGQTIDLTNVGYGSNATSYSDEFSTDNKVTDDATYQALKDRDDWWTATAAYSRYNHDSAVRTIKSLPDTSAGVAEYGTVNTIKFQSNQGGSTDGGEVGTLTEEEIAIATEKGWTVAFVSRS